MSTIDKLNKINETKLDIKNALIEKNVTVSDSDTFASYADKVTSIQAGGGGNPIETINNDFGSFGYSQSEVPYDKINIATYDNDIAYSKTKFGEWDPSRTSASNLYKGDKTLVYVPKIDTSKVTTMNHMFYNCQKLINVPDFDTSKVTNMYSMFNNCKSLTTVPLFDTSKVTDISYMFSDCISLTAVPMFDTSKVTNMDYMFQSCNSLTNLGGFKNLKVSLDLHWSSKLTKQSLMNIINNLADLKTLGLATQTLTLHATSLVLLSESDKAIATNKGWNITA